MLIKGNNVLITGASGGIGRHIALAFAEEGANISLVDMDSGKLTALATEIEKLNKQVVAINADITKEEDLDRIVKETESTIGPLDILVNCAGIMPFKWIKDHTEDDILRVLMVNIYGTIRLTQKVIPSMCKRQKGHIVNIGSIFGSLSFPLYGIYSASKFAVRGFSEALRRELAGTGVSVTYIAPRATKTSQSAAFFEIADKVSMNLDNPEKVAATIVRSVKKETDEVYIGRAERFFVFINKIFPGLVDKALQKNIPVMSEYIGRI